MMTKKQIILILVAIPFFLFMLSPEEGSHSSHYAEFIGKMINFIVLFGGLAYLLRKPAIDFLQKRGQEIAKSLEEEADSRQESEKKLQKAKIRLEKIAKEIEALKVEAEKEGQNRKKEIIHTAKQEAARMKKLAKQQIDMLTKASIRELKEYVAELITASAEGRIQKRITQRKHKFLIDQSIEQVEKLYEKSNYN